MTMLVYTLGWSSDIFVDTVWKFKLWHDKKKNSLHFFESDSHLCITIMFVFFVFSFKLNFKNPDCIKEILNFSIGAATQVHVGVDNKQVRNAIASKLKNAPAAKGGVGRQKAATAEE